MPVSVHDRLILRDLAARVAEIAARPEMARRIAAWTAHNALRDTTPLVLIFPEGAWAELLPPHVFQCEDEAARGIEFELRHRIYTFEHFQSDNVIDGCWKVGPALRHSGWGLEAKRHASSAARGAWSFEPVITCARDLERIRMPEIELDAAATAARVAAAQELFGDILTVRQVGLQHFSFHFMSLYTGWRGLAEVMLDMYEEPEMLHDAMARLEAGYHGLLRQYEALNLLTLNNDNTYHSSGGNGWTDELPAPGFDPARVRYADLWGSAESQELAQVSPAQHAEFVLPYESRLLARFGLTGYGCCEDLTDKLDDVCRLPHLRRISIAPWADVERCAARLQGDYLYSWKPNPAYLVGDFDPAQTRDYVAKTLRACAAHGCVPEIILKDTHTCEGRPERFDRWTEVTRALIEDGIPA